MLQQISIELAKTQTTLVAVSKTKPVTQILDLYHQGQRDFGENRVQELVQKQSEMPNDINWHLIGHLQTNKVKQVASFVHLIHSVDSDRLLLEINKQAQKNDRVIDCLLQFKIAEEQSKYGFDLEMASAFLESVEFNSLQNVRILGFTGIAVKIF